MIRLRGLLFSTLLVLLVVQGSARSHALDPSRQTASTPKLVVMLVVDQMRTDYLERYSAHFSGGLNRLMREGAWFERGAFPYANTVTCAGHSTIGTGALPYRHGMVLNEWYDRAAGKSVACTVDASVKKLSEDGQPGTGDSPRFVLAPSLAEQIRARGGRVVTMSLKARSAIGLAGHAAGLVLWFEERGRWSTSSAYADELDPFVRQYVEAHPVAADLGKTWDRSLDAAAYKYSDDGVGERPPTGWTKTFPHPIGAPSGPADAAFFTHWQRSPFADEYLGRMAAAAIDAVGLGTGNRTDFLGVSFSSLDYVGHAFGPNSHEVQDMVQRLDATIGRLLAHLDEKVGRGNYVLALTADHGVADIPEQVGAGRQTSRDVSAALDAALQPIFGPGKYMAFSAYTDIYLAAGVMDRLRKSPEATRAALDALRALPGTAFAFTNDEIRGPAVRTDPDPVKRAVALSYHEGRSGDLLIVPREKWILSSSATTHGTLYPYDQRVPIIFVGPGVTAGRYDSASTPADIAPTLAALAGMTIVPADGRSLQGAMAASRVTR
jgi:predicted AlkP superfamily pyrophosphatase or phosphodiesterase